VTDPATLPLFPLGTVLFPGLVLPLHVFEPRYRALVRHLMELPDGTPRVFGVVAIKQGTAVGESPVTLYDVGCTAELRQVTAHPDGRYNIVTVGRRRFRLASISADDAPYVTAQVEFMPEQPGDDALADRLVPGVQALFQRYLHLVRMDEEELGEQLPDDPTVLSHVIAATAQLTLDDRQRLLAAPDPAARLSAERVLLSREVALLGQVRAVPVQLDALVEEPPSPN
jgi:Lon protease-like protein